jgi:hypothetical protein
MTVDPNDLLIFKARKTGQQPESQQQPRQRPVALSEKAAGASPKNSPAPDTPIPNPRMMASSSPKPEETQQQAEPIVAELKSRELPDRGFMSAKASAKTEEEAHPYVFDETIPIPDVPPVPIKTSYQEKKILTKNESRQAAAGKVCFWHNWRNAYGICTICKKAFCYEDIVEYGNSMYCLEDIGQAEAGYSETVYTNYNNLSLVSALLFILAFVVFLYLANTQISYLLTYAVQNGIPGFVFSIAPSYIYVLWGLIISLAGVLVALIIMLRLRSAFAFGMIDGIFAIAIFTYGFFLTNTLYMGAISAMYFVAMVNLTYSRTAYRMEAENLDYLAKSGVIGA